MQSLSAEERKQIEICITSVQSLKGEKSLEYIPPLLNPNWDQAFEVDWDDLSKDIATQLDGGKRLNPRDKREFVRFLSKSITNFCPRPKRKNLVTIIQKVVNKYPKSLSDMWCDETAGIGYESLLRKVVYRIENLNRTALCSAKLNVDSDGKIKRPPSYKFYGCSNWQPLINDDEVVLEQKRNTLKDMYAKGSKIIDPVSRVLMHETYKLQRRDINRDCDVKKLMTDWPFLFTIEGLLGHFNELVGIDLRNKLENALFVKGNLIVTFMSRITEKSLKREKLKDTIYDMMNCDVMPQEYVSDVSGLLMLLTEYFEEKKESFYMNLESSVTAKEVERILNLQNISSPFIIVRGPCVLTYDSCMLCVEGKVIIEKISSFKDAFMGLFCLFYCLNINYPISASATLEFVQRCFFNINPEYGSKVQKRSKWKMSMKVTNLIDMLSEQEQ